MKKGTLNNIVIKDNNIYKEKINSIKKNIDKSSVAERGFLMQDLHKYTTNYENGNEIIKLLVNSDIDMTVFHDLNILYNNKRCHIGFLIITNKNIFVLYYNDIFDKISIDNKNNFYKMYYKKKISLFNPINILQRHINIINECFDNEYKDFIYGYVVLNKNVKLSGKINDKRIIKYNHLIKNITQIEKKSKISLKLNVKNLVKKIEEIIIDEEVVENITYTENDFGEKMFDLNEIIKRKLINYRTFKSKEFKNTPSYILSNNLINQIVNIKPNSKEELINIKGFSIVKYNKYGKDILRIIAGK